MKRNFRNGIIFLLMFAAGSVMLAILYFLDPSCSGFYPRCPFFVLTGWQCPGCGTLRAVHCLLHGRIVEAWNFNPAMIVSLPILAFMFASAKFPRSAKTGWAIIVAAIAWWIGRNVF